MRRRLSRRSQLVWARSRAKNQVHAVLMRQLVGRPPFSDVFGIKGRRWLAELALPLEERETVDSAMRQIAFLDAEITAAERLIAQAALSLAGDQAVDERPGVNVIVAATFMAAVGDIHRFKNPRKLVGYLGLDPEGPPVRGRARDARPHLKARLDAGASRAGRGVLDDGPPARPAARVLPARPWTPRSLRRDRRRRPQARVPVLVPAHPRRGLRLPTAVADEEEAAAPGDRRRRAEVLTRGPRASGPRTTRCAKRSSSSPAKPRSPTNGPSATTTPPRQARPRRWARA